jgi:hypothetical protein
MCENTSPSSLPFGCGISTVQVFVSMGHDVDPNYTDVSTLESQVSLETSVISHPVKWRHLPQEKIYLSKHYCI